MTRDEEQKFEMMFGIINGQTRKLATLIGILSRKADLLTEDEKRMLQVAGSFPMGALAEPETAEIIPLSSAARRPSGHKPPSAPPPAESDAPKPPVT